MLKLQQVDLQALKLQKQFEELPQRQKIVDAREKQQQLAAKLETIDALLAKADKAINVIIEKDQCLEKRQAEIQKDIDAAGGDFRNLEARTNELAAQGEARERLVPELEKAEAEKTKIVDARNQVLAAAKKIAQIEAAAIESFKKEGGALQQAIIAIQAERKAMAQELGADLMKVYDKAAKAGAGVAIGLLIEGRCGSCRAPIDDARMVELKKNAPLATCPHCKRLIAMPTQS